ncbi:MAG TPA: NADH:flavin oxidoreductase [Halanaerobiales bacterium]|nr:NADH:flavin oxidoreductase [Halanaerobiales bacterium]
MANLLSPIKIKNLKVKNRIVMPPLATREATRMGMVTDKLTEQYKNRPNVGMIIVEHSYVRREGRVNNHQLGIYDESHIAGLGKLAHIIRENGSLAVIQISHGGSASKSHILGRSAFAPSEVKHPGRDIDETPTALMKDDLKELKRSFVKSALRAKKAGFNIVELHGAHGYLLNQFMSPLTNKRDDEYGGDLKNRMRFPLEIVRAIRGAVGRKYPIAYRLGCDDFLPGGIKIEDSIEAAQMLEEAGVDLLDLSGGLTGYNVGDDEEGYFVYMGEAIRPEVGVPVIVTGGIETPEFANKIIEDGKADLVGIGRAMLQDKNWAKKAVEKIK